jgi:DNA-binding phage protein
LYSKVLSLSSGFSKEYEGLLSHVEKELSAYNSHQRYYLSQNHQISDSNVDQILTFIPSLNNSYKLKLCVKANLMKISQEGAEFSKEKIKIFLSKNIEPSEQYFDSVLSVVRAYDKTRIFEDFGDYFGHPENGEAGKLLSYILTNRHSVRTKVLEIYREILSEFLETKKYNFNPIELIFKMANTENTLENERVKENQLEKLMNVFRAQNMSLTLQKVYLRYLVSLFWIKFTPLYKFVHKALAEFLENYHETMIDEFLGVVDTFDYMLKVGPTDSILSRNLYPSLIPSYPRMR